MEHIAGAQHTTGLYSGRPPLEEPVAILEKPHWIAIRVAALEPDMLTPEHPRYGQINPAEQYIGKDERKKHPEDHAAQALRLRCFWS